MFEDKTSRYIIVKVPNRALKDFLVTFWTINDFVLANIRKNYRMYKIGVLSLFLVIMFLVAFQSLIQLSSLILLKIAEDQKGHVDILLSPVNDTRSPLNSNEFPIEVVNVAEVRSKLAEVRSKLEGALDVAAISPRWVVPIDVSVGMGQSQLYKAKGILLDSASERKQGLGWRLEAKDLNYGECWITRPLANAMQLKSKHLYIDTNIILLH